MSPDPSADAEAASAAEPEPKRRADRPSFIPTLAVVAVAIAAVAAAFMGTRTDTPEAKPAACSCPRRRKRWCVRQPLRERHGRRDRRARSAASSNRCSPAKPGDTFQMRIRMDDGSLRTVEQRGALAAGTRVVVEGGSVRLPG